MSAPRTILIISGGVEALPGIERARALGFRVAVSDGNPRAPGAALADHFLEASTYDPAATAAAAQGLVAAGVRLCGVLSVGADVPVTVATVAQRLGLPGLDLETARICADKLAMKRHFEKAGVPVPWFAPVATRRDLAIALAERGRTLVLKPVDSRGSRGVIRVTARTDLAWALAEALSYSPSKRLLVEDYIPGAQISTESLIIEGRTLTPGFSDRNYERLGEFGPFFVEDGGDLPSRLPPARQEAIRRLIEETATALGMRSGTLKGDVVWDNASDRPLIIEVAPRLSGGYFCSHEIPLNTGVDFLGIAIRLAAGESVDPSEGAVRFQRHVCQRYAFVPPGRVVHIAGLAEARGLPGVEAVMLHVAPGDIIRPTTNTTSRAAMVIATGEDRASAEANARAALARLTVEIAPETEQRKAASG
ncbi:MAG: ATP-grasp domain-containing protein [Alphaproteobacteria bacterium]|nr:ATP-grasp domain-containing protein [Alphaproteobacteria bacterium]